MARLKICRKPECSNTIPYDQINPYCDLHKEYYHPRNYVRRFRKRSDQYYNKYKRDKEANAFYHSKQWKRISNQIKLREINTCSICGRTFDRSGYLITDHIIPRKIDKRLQLSPSNLWVLCQKCHYWKSEWEKKTYISKSKIENLDTSKKYSKEDIKQIVLKHSRKKTPRA